MTLRRKLTTAALGAAALGVLDPCDSYGSVPGNTTGLPFRAVRTQVVPAVNW